MELEEHIRMLEEQLLTAEVRTSIGELESLLSNDFLEFTSSGQTKNKQDCLDGLTVFESTRSDFEIKPLASDVVLITYRLHDLTKKQHTLRSSIWKDIDGRWQMCFHQGTPVESK
ncbi:DUF4440 domain-containing protein [Bacillus sp. V59.32b]|uniref:nuclear transport factor 2 family protein n=1 Tax=Bacillus sp. V59.32b TaxID=1758642 RepID=UPI000E3EBA99|nr:DUF4440 domain-containing protein [Bacillus sp. V59.32b]RFU68680.1 DUF4440 domain-containing protein [Bacillus sp. V59.32b]